MFEECENMQNAFSAVINFSSKSKRTFSTAINSIHNESHTSRFLLTANLTIFFLLLLLEPFLFSHSLSQIVIKKLFYLFYGSDFNWKIILQSFACLWFDIKSTNTFIVCNAVLSEIDKIKRRIVTMACDFVVLC